MGLFGSTKIYVSSTVYNMAGDINKRPNYLKTLVAGHVITDNGDKSMSSSIQEGYLRGPGIRYRNFANWAKTNYPAIGLIQGSLYSQISIPTETIAAQISHDANQTVVIQKLEVLPSDYSYWATQWMMQNYPLELGSAWYSTVDTSGQITITRSNAVSASITPADYKRDGMFLYATYTLVTGSEYDPVQVGAVKTLGAGEAYPSVAGWSNISNTTTSQTVTLNKVVKTTVSYSDGRPDEVTTDNSQSTASFNYYRAHYTTTEYQGSTPVGSGPDQITSLKKDIYLFRDGAAQTPASPTVTETTENLNDGKLVKRTRVETTQDQLVVTQSYRLDTQEMSSQTYSPAQMFIYEIGSGNAAIDVHLTQDDQDGFYFPFIPVRLDNQMVDAVHWPDVRAQNEKAYYKLTGSKKYGDEVVEALGKSENLKDMDYVYIVLGVSLNTKENAAKEYLYRFFESLYLRQTVGATSYSNWQSSQTSYDSAQEEWLAWRDAQKDPSNPLYGTSKPYVPSFSAIPSNMVSVHSAGTLDGNFDMRITWQAISLVTGSGKFQDGAKTGDFFVQSGGSDSYAVNIYNQGRILSGTPITADHLSIAWQVDDNNFKILQIVGLVHRNYIYDSGHFVETSASAAMADSNESPFLVPLHYGIYKELSIVAATQLSMASCYIAINSYQIVHTGFFQSFFFKILLVVAVIAISVATGGIGATSAGLLGTNVAVGTAIGLTGTLAIIAGAAINAIAAMILVSLVQKGATLVFGEKLGAIIGAIVALVAVQVGSSLNSGGSLSSSFASLARADNIINMTSAVGSGIAGYVQAGALDIQAQTAQLQKDYQTQSDQYEKLYEQNIGYDRAQFDPLGLFQNLNTIPESSATFLQRTLMTGSDVADLSMSLISNFPKITLSTDLDLSGG